MNMDQIQYYVDRLMRAPDEVSFLVITISGSEDFLQLTTDAGGAQIDPLDYGKAKSQKFGK